MGWIDDEGYEHLSWAEIEDLVEQLARQLLGKQFDLYLVIAVGGLIPGALLAKRLNHRSILVTCIEAYGPDDQPLEQPIVHQFPDESLLRGKRVLIVDDVWHRGTTINVAIAKVRHAGATPLVATLHYKPGQSIVAGRPDFCAVESEQWIVYPWEELQGKPVIPAQGTVHEERADGLT